MPWLLLLAFLSSCSGQTLTLTGPATASPGATIPVSLMLISPGPDLAALQWTLPLPVGVTATVAIGSAGNQANKDLLCAGRTCILSGPNVTTIPAGVVAVYSVQLPPTPGTLSFVCTGPLGASGLGEPIAVTSGAPYVIEVSDSGPPYPVTDLRVQIAEASVMAISWAELTEGYSTSNPASTASISPTANVPVFVTVALSVVGGGTTNVSDSVQVAGCNLTWTQIGRVETWASRRALYVFHGVGASPSSGALTITFTSGNGSTFEQAKWSADQATGVDATTPYGTAYTYGTAAAVTSATVTVSETPDAGDHVFAAFGLEDNYATTLNAELETKLTDFGDATGARHLTVAYNSAPDSTPTPGITWSTGCGAGALAFIVNVAAGAPAGNPWYYYAQQ